MNILFVIGNGFDINLGLNTSFRNFYEYYKNQKSNSELISKLKNNIDGKKNDWSDLEISFGKYLSNFTTLEEFDEVFDDLKDNLCKFLKDEEIKFDSFDKNFFNIIESLITPENFLLPADQALIRNHYNKHKGSEISTFITTFNYTRVFEKILNFEGEKHFLGTRPDHSRVNLYSINHIHGFVEKNMILGVNDKTQINNDDFKDDDNIITSIVKSETNRVFKLQIESKFKTQIKRSNLIVIFGCSLGLSDKMWWDLIAKKLKEDCYLILFWKGVELKPNQEARLFRYENDIKNKFFDVTGMNEEDRVLLKDKIFIGLNRHIFKII